jgi:hypothetical protein
MNGAGISQSPASQQRAPDGCVFSGWARLAHSSKFTAVTLHREQPHTALHCTKHCTFVTSSDAAVTCAGRAGSLVGLTYHPAALPARRYDKLRHAQADGKCTVGTVLQWYGKTHQLSDAALSLLDGMLAIDQASQSTLLQNEPLPKVDL